MTRETLPPPANFQEMMADTLDIHLPLAGKVVLEIASDPWLLSAKRFVQQGAARVIASDLFGSWVQVFDPNVETMVLDARRLHEVLAEESIDAVYGINLLEHLSDIEQALDSIRRVLKPGGACLLHGHPLWTSSRGHHAMLGHVGATFAFSDDTNPIPLWGHLYLNPQEMRERLASAGHSEDVIAAALDWSYSSEHITRKPRREILASIERSSLPLETFWEDRLESPDEPTLQLIRASPWWDPEEDYASRGITCVFRRAKADVT